MIIHNNYCADNTKGFWVYVGKDKKSQEIVYVGTTMQKPSDRFRWHRHNGKDLLFYVVYKCNNTEDMFDKEVELINKYSPKLNKKVTKHNNNKKLTKEELDNRIGDKGWCQCCLKRRVSTGYTICYYCSKN